MGWRPRDQSSEEVASQYRNVVAIVDDADGSIGIDELAERLVKQDQTLMSADEYADAHERKLIALRHNVLPRLARSGVLDYDRESNRVSTTDDGMGAVDWGEEDSIAGALSSLRNGGPADTDTIGVLRGRRAAIEHGRALADEAEDELFCIYANTALLEDECLRHAADAIDRGVEMYVGSRNADVRTLTRQRLPDATIWEPQRGWLNASAGYPMVGRLVLGDRRKVMLAVLEGPGPDGEHSDESAMIGAGVDNPLVVLVRELLGPRLDHLDHQSADFRSQLHS